MTQIIRNTAQNDFFHSNIFKAQTEEVIFQAKELSLPFGEGYMAHWYSDGIRLGYSRWKYEELTSAEWHSDLDMVHLDFNLRGRKTIELEGFEKPVSSSGFELNMMYSRGFKGVIYQEELETEGFIMQLTKNAFLKIAGGLFRDFEEKVLQRKSAILNETNLSVTLPLHSAIREILNCRRTGALKKMFLKAKSLEILALVAEAFEKSGEQKAKFCKTEYDRERLLFARDYLISHMNMPPTLSELARTAGINEFKLKNGFKEIFGTTVFGYLSDYRLDQAKFIITEGKKSATDIAFELGYSSLQHFSAAFKKKFGVAPTQLLG
ncbi:MAG TPA: AraC family transcriptional regulator [Patescibacteria group bacterium]|nr:AraC family transcriptional regulator [Patescibacteria group bacterium]